MSRIDFHSNVLILHHFQKNKMHCIVVCKVSQYHIFLQAVWAKFSFFMTKGYDNFLFWADNGGRRSLNPSIFGQHHIWTTTKPVHYQFIWFEIKILFDIGPKRLELLRNNWAKPMQKCLQNNFSKKKFIQIFLIPMLIEEYQIIFSTL